MKNEDNDDANLSNFFRRWPGALDKKGLIYEANDASNDRQMETGIKNFPAVWKFVYLAKKFQTQKVANIILEKARTMVMKIMEIKFQIKLEFFI